MLDKYSTICGTLIFSIIFWFICILSNSKVATTANTIVEIVLAFVNAFKEHLLNKFYDYFYNEINTNAESIATNDMTAINENYNLWEREITNYISNILFPLLIINGIALLLCVFHSYWIEKYNSGDEIIWDN